MSYDTVRRWKKKFESGVESIKNAPKSGRPKSASRKEIVSNIKEIIEGDARFTVRDIARKVGISLSTVHLISSPVRSTRRAIVVTPVVHVCVCVSRHTALKFFKCLYLNSHSSQRHQIWNLGTLEGLLRFQENKPLGSCPWVGLGVRI